ncbi:MAG: type II secretion system protein GspK [Myxococcota bacterium]|nr:type II secretion system protein GspK [Myxococcota bacterium]
MSVRRTRRQRGVALLMVLIALTILGAMTADLMESNEVYLATTVNARDSVRAEYMARSGIHLSRLLLSFQRLLGSSVSFPFWQYADLIVDVFTDSEGGGLLGDLAGIDVSGVEGLGLGVKDGDLKVTIIDEDSKINVNLANSQGYRNMRKMMFDQLMQLIAPMEYDPIFDREAKAGQVFDRESIICEIMDWADGDEDLCDMSGSEDPSYYQMLDPEYLRKNAPFDSLMELHLVKGIDDDFWSAFVEPNPEDPEARVMTVWGRGRINVNTAPAQVLLPVICMLASDQSGVSLCADPAQYANLLVILQAFVFIRQFMPFSRSGEFLSAIQNPERLFLQIPGFPIGGKGMARRVLSTRSTVFSIYAEGTVGRVTKRIHAVIDTKGEDMMMLGPENAVAAAGGKVLYWRMD